MIKYFILLLNFVGFLLVDLFMGTISVSINAPSEVAAGDSFTVEITFSKADLQSMGRYKQELPVGYSATSINVLNGEFTFKDNNVKVLWSPKLPSDSVFTISYLIKVHSTAVGPLVLDSGSFVYINKNNERTTYYIPSKTIIIRPQGTIANNNTQNPDSINNQQIVNNSTIQNFPTDQIFCYRQIIRDIDGITVHLLVNTGNLSKDKFGKVQEKIPAGYTATNIESKDGIFSFKDNSVKFLWMTLPAESQYQISYKLTATSPTSDMPDISGNFSYVENEGTKIKTIENREFLGNNMMANNTNNQNSNNQNTNNQTNNNQVSNNQNTNNQTTNNNNQTSNNQTTNNQTNNTQNTNNQTTNNQTNNNQNTNNQNNYNQTNNNNQVSNNQTVNNQNIVSPEKGVTYKVQIGAYKKYLNVSYFKKLQVTEPVSVELNNGLNKYLIGLHSIYKEARDHRTDIWQKTPIRDAFVSAYNNGNRITVQEALMIANQKWYQ